MIDRREPTLNWKWPRRWRGPWLDLDKWDEERRELIKKLRTKTEGVPDDWEITLRLSAMDCERIEWSLGQMPRLRAAEMTLERIRNRFADAADMLVNEEGGWRFREALKRIGLVPSEGKRSRYPDELLRFYTALVTSKEPVNLPTPFGLVFIDYEATARFDECPMTPAEAVRALRELYGGATDAACLKAIRRQLLKLKKAGADVPEIARLLSVPLPKPSELI